MVGSGRTNKMRWTKNGKAAQLLKKMFLDLEIDPDHFSAESIFESQDIFQRYEFNIFAKHLRDMAESVKSAGGVEFWDGGK